MVIPHFCRQKIIDPETGIERICGKTNPEDFENRRKGICKSCRSHANNILNKTKNQKSKEVVNLEKKEEELKEIQIKTIKLKSKLELETEANVLTYFKELAGKIPLIGTRSIIDAIKGTEEEFSASVENNSKKFSELFVENKKLKQQIEALSTKLEFLNNVVNTIVSKINQ